jgi:hypothetical protein
MLALALAVKVWRRWREDKETILESVRKGKEKVCGLAPLFFWRAAQSV